MLVPNSQLQIKTCTDDELLKSEKAYAKILSFRKEFFINILRKDNLYLTCSTHFITATC